jgi:hypothetical protein
MSWLILRDAASRLLRMRFEVVWSEILDPHGEGRGNAARLESRGRRSAMTGQIGLAGLSANRPHSPLLTATSAPIVTTQIAHQAASLGSEANLQ